METFRKRPKTGGRIKGTLNRVTADLRQALQQLADGNVDRVQSWLDRVAESDPGEAVRLYLALLRFVTPTLQAAAIADLTRRKSTQEQLNEKSDEELMESLIANSPELWVDGKAPQVITQEQLEQIARGERPTLLIEYKPELDDPILA